MGALLSFFGAAAAFMVAKALGIRPLDPLGPDDSMEVSEPGVDIESTTNAVGMAEVSA